MRFYSSWLFLILTVISCSDFIKFFVREVILLLVAFRGCKGFWWILEDSISSYFIDWVVNLLCTVRIFYLYRNGFESFYYTFFYILKRIFFRVYLNLDRIEIFMNSSWLFFLLFYLYHSSGEHSSKSIKNNGEKI